MLINFVVLCCLLFIFSKFAGIQGVPTNDEGVKEYEKSLNLPKKESRFHFVISTDKLMWRDASLACKKKGMFLACLDTTEKYTQYTAALGRYIGTNRGSEIDTYWIGGFGEHNLEKFQWENGNIINSYDCKKGEPIYSPYEYCLEFKMLRMLSGWSNAGCDKLLKYICMYDDLEEETKNTEHINIDTQRLETYLEVNKNLEPTESTTEVSKYPTEWVFPSGLGYRRPWGNPEVLSHDYMYDSRQQYLDYIGY